MKITQVSYLVEDRKPGGPWRQGSLPLANKELAISSARLASKEGKFHARVRKLVSYEEIVWRNKPLRKGRVKKND